MWCSVLQCVAVCCSVSQNHEITSTHSIICDRDSIIYDRDSIINNRDPIICDRDSIIYDRDPIICDSVLLKKVNRVQGVPPVFSILGFDHSHHLISYGVATMSRLLKITGLFRRISSLL